MSPGGIIAARDLSRWYGEVVGLNQVTFDVDAPVVGLLGPNGSGKSTLLHLVTGQIQPSRGTLTVMGEHPWNNPRLMGKLGFVPETDAFWEWMSGREFVEHLLLLGGAAPGAARTDASDALATARLEEAAWDRPLGTYSRGMRQKTKIAQAIAHKPPMLILDEPLTGADPLSRRHINELVRQQAKEGTRILVSSHVLHEVEALTEEVLVLSRGRLVARGLVPEIRALIDEHPRRVRVAVSDARRLARGLIEESGVVSVAFEEGGLLVETRDPERFSEIVPRLCLKDRLRLTRVEPVDESLEAVFDYLFEKRRGEST